MAGSDHVLFNTLEKARSPDLNNLQAMQARALADILRYSSMTLLPGLNAAADTETVHPVVGGLQVIPDTNNVIVKPGFLMQDSAALAPAPGSYDSDYRVAFNRANLSVAAPAPLGNTWYLLEAQMTESVTLSEARDVLNTATGNFVSTVVDKHNERIVSTQWVTGTSTNYPTPTGGDWVVLAGVYRAAGGGAVTQDDIRDMRPLASTRHHDREDFTSRSLSAVVNRCDMNATDLKLEAHANVSGLALKAKLLTGTPVGFDPDAAAVLDTTTTVAASTWYYLYLCPWNGYTPRNYYLNSDGVTVGCVAQGVLVLSAQVPAEGGATNNATLNLPAPYASTVAAGGAALVGILRRNIANTAWHLQQGGNGQVIFTEQDAGATPAPFIDAAGVYLSTGTVPSSAGTNVASTPGGIKSAIFSVFVVPTFNTGDSAAIGVMAAAVENTANTVTYAEIRHPMISNPDTIEWSWEVEVAYDSAGYDFTFLMLNSTFDGWLVGGTVDICLRGYKL